MAEPHAEGHLKYFPRANLLHYIPKQTGLCVSVHSPISSDQKGKVSLDMPEQIGKIEHYQICHIPPRFWTLPVLLE